MSRFQFGKLLIVAAIIFLFFIIPGNLSLAVAQSDEYRRIVLLADPHLPFRAFEITDPSQQMKLTEAKNKLITDINAWEDVGEIVVLGDIVGEVGSIKEYAYAAEYFSKFNKPLSFIVGNHDYIYIDTPGPNGQRIRGDANSQRIKLNRFKETFGLSELFYTQKVGNYLLVFLSIDSLESPYLSQISDRQLTWLRGELKKNQTTPTIIFYHAPLKGALSNYNKFANTPNFIAQPEQALREIIHSNPQIRLWISGHTHTPASNPSFASAINLYEGKVMNIHNTDLDREVIWTNSLYLYPDKVIIKTFNHKSGRWVDELERTISIAH